MKIVFDQGTPVPLRRQLTGHTIAAAIQAILDVIVPGRITRFRSERGSWPGFGLLYQYYAWPMPSCLAIVIRWGLPVAPRGS